MSRRDDERSKSGRPRRELIVEAFRASGCRDLAAFKAGLLLAHRAGVVVLSRVDMPASYDASELALSTVTHGAAEYNRVTYTEGED